MENSGLYCSSKHITSFW